MDTGPLIDKEKLKRIDREAEKLRNEIVELLARYMKVKHGVEKELGIDPEKADQVIQSLRQMLSDEEIRQAKLLSELLPP